MSRDNYDDYDEDTDARIATHELVLMFVKSLKYLFLPLPKKDYVEIWSREGFPFREKMMNGVMASMIGMSCTIPVDLLRHFFLMYRAWPKSLESYSYTSAFGCFYHTAYSKTFLGMYRTAAIDIWLRTPKVAVKMVLNDYFGYALTSPRGEYPPFNRFLAAIMSGLCQGLVSSPFEYYRYRFWGSRQFRAWYMKPMTNVELWEQLVSPRGRQHWCLVVRAQCTESILFSFIYFPLQHHLLTLVSPKDTRPGPWLSYVTGWLAATITLLTVTPFDNIRKQASRIPDYTDLYPCPHDKPDYENLRHVYRRYVDHLGWKALFRGWWCRVGVKARIYGVIQLVYDLNLTEGLITKERRYKTLDDFKLY